MKEYSPLKITDILKRKHFENAVVIAGGHGIQQSVKWVHVVEVTNIRNLLNGNELILSTGVAWKDDETLFISILNQLIENRASGICIEMGTYISAIPAQVIEIANRHQFPIIIFQNEVPFVEITQDIHSLIINQQYQIISRLEDYSQKLNKMLLTIKSYDEILHCLFSYLDIQIIFRLKDQEYQYFPEMHNKDRACILPYIKNENEIPANLVRSPIYLFGQEFAELFIYSQDDPITDFELLILDRTSNALGQMILRDLCVEEKKRVEESEWLQGWLDGDHALEGIIDYLMEQGLKIKSTDAVVVIAKQNVTNDKACFDKTYLKLLFRSVFEQNGFHVLIVEKRNEVIFILLNNRTNRNISERTKKAIESIQHSEFIRKQGLSSVCIGVGKVIQRLGDIEKSYQSAIETLRIQKKMKRKEFFCFYEHLHLYRLISIMSKHVDLQEQVMEYLHPVIHYDQTYNGKLLETLRLYLECNGSKQETANKLFIVRQTLYHRLQKLEKLLGNDFMNHDKRVAIEFMLLVRDYLTPEAEKENIRGIN